MTLSKSRSSTLAVVAAMALIVSAGFYDAVFAQGATGGVIGKQNKDASGGSDAAPASRRAAPKPVTKPAETPNSKSAGCNRAVGVWFWVTEVVTIKSDGSMSAKGGPGNWTCVDGLLHVFWPGFIVPHEIFSISEDGNKLISHNTSSAPTRIR